MSPEALPKTNDLSWVIGGAQGSGVDSSANIFARAVAFGGLHVFGKREYYSNIMGKHSYFQVHVSGRPIRSHLDRVDILATFDAETVFRHANDVVAGGAIIYDPELERVSLDEVSTIAGRVKGDLKAFLESHGGGETVGDMLRIAEARGVRRVPVPYQELLRVVADEYEVDQLSKISRMVNVMAIGASFGLLGYDGPILDRAIESVFEKKPKIVEMNAAGARKAYDLVAETNGNGFGHRLEPIPTNERRMLLGGNQAVALGKILGGCRFQTYYPITPASDESEYLEAHAVLGADGSDRPEAEESAFLEGNGHSILVIQTEDEIAAITMATGAALTGTRSATATSGPGFSLMAEGLGWAGINEVPVVVTLYQRAGPSTGMPTRHEQGDLRFALHAGHGEFPRIVLASGDFEECVVDAIRIFNYAERYQMPAIHIVDKAIANSTRTMAVPDLSGERIDRGLLLGDGKALAFEGEYKRFLLTEDGISPRVPLGTPNAIFWMTGDEHDERGHITEDPVVRNRMMDKRFGKFDLALREIPVEDQVRFHGDSDAETVLVSWGSTKGAILDAMDEIRAEGGKVGFLQVRLLSPFPADRVAAVLGKAKRVVDIEMNYTAQLAGLVREMTGVAATHLILKFNGRPMSSEELVPAIRRVVDGEAPAREVLTHGA